MESRIFNTWRNPYGQGYSTTRARQIILNKGVTVLVGCNGSGKSTLLNNIKEELGYVNIPVMYFDNLHQGKYFSSSNEVNQLSSRLLVNCSEGEVIQLNISQVIQELKTFLISGAPAADLHSHSAVVQSSSTNERFILLDGIDSGYSIDNIIDLKELFDIVIEDGTKSGLDVYIVVAANNYEFTRDQYCFDVMEGKYITFDNYSDYKAFILKTRQKRDRRIETALHKKTKGDELHE